MDKKALEEMLKRLSPDKLSKVKTLIEGKDLGEVLSGVDIKKAEDALSKYNIDSEKLSGVINEVKNNPAILEEIKNKLK